MADAPRGAVAPIPAAVRAALPITTPQAPAELLADRVLDRVNRLLALCDMARAQPLGDPDLPTGGDSTDSTDRLAALLHCLNVELCDLHTMVSPEGREDAAVPLVQAEPAPIALPAAVHQAAPKAAAGAAEPLQFFELECTYHVAGSAAVGDLAIDAHSLVSSAVAVLSLVDLATDAQFAVLHLLRQAAGLLSLAHTKHEREQLAQRKQGGAA